MKYERTRLDFELSAALRDAMSAFPDAVETVDDFGNPVFTIAPRVTEFGPLVAELSPGSGLTLSIGFFTHFHFEADVSDAPPPRELVKALVSRLADVVADRLVAYGSPRGGGTFLRGEQPSGFGQWLADGRYWLWSGRFDLDVGSAE